MLLEDQKEIRKKKEREKKDSKIKRESARAREREREIISFEKVRSKSQRTEEKKI